MLAVVSGEFCMLAITSGKIRMEGVANGENRTLELLTFEIRMLT